MGGDKGTGIPPIGDRLGYLLKHAWLRMTALSAEALRPYDITGRELAVLSVLGEGEPPSQLEAAGRLGIDRTTMVGLVDALEEKRLVERRPDPVDRRRNIVVLTAGGRDTLVDASRAADGAEREFLASLPQADADRLRRMLQAISRAGADADPGSA